MGIGDTWAGSFGHTTIVEGEFEVLDWSNCLVLINDVNVERMFYCENTRTTDFGTGPCTIRAADPDRVQYLLFQEGDEIEIYMADTDVSNKVWGGYVEGLSMSQEKGETLTIKGSEYARRLLNQTFTDTFSADELSDAVTTILGNQTDFSTSIPATISKPVSGDFTKEPLYYALKKFCDQWNYDFWVDVNKVARMQLRSTVTLSPDIITSGDNVTKTRSEERSKYNLCNSVTVKGSNSTQQTADDTDSQTDYGIHDKVITIAGLNTAATVQQYADQYIEDNKDPRDNQRILTKLLAYTDPREYIQVDIADLGLEDEYQVISVTHRWGENAGLHSEVELTDYITDTSQQMGVFERRIQDVEKEAF